MNRILGKLALLVLLLLVLLISGHYQLADPDLFEAGSFSPFERLESDVFELLPYEGSHHHYRYHPPRPVPVKLVRRLPAPSAKAPLSAVQKVVLPKPTGSHYSFSSSTSSMAYTLGAVVLALLGQAVGTVFFALLAKLLLGIKALLATNGATLGLALWSHLKQKIKHQKVKKMHQKKKKKQKKKKYHMNMLQLSKKQLKKILAFLKKKKKQLFRFFD